MSDERDGGFASGPGAEADDLEHAFSRALRQAATAGSGAASRPGQVRHHLVTLLGPERSVALRSRLHRAVAAAEEQVPATLVSLAPVSEDAFRRLVANLAERRGWTIEAASQTTRDWRDALGLSPALSGPSTAPGSSNSEVLEEQAADPGTSRTTTWAASRPRTAALARLTGLPARAAAHAYGGLSLRLFWILITVLAVLALGAALALPSALPGHPNALVSGLSVLAAVGLSTRLGRGLLVVTDDGLTFVRFDRRMTAPAGSLVTAPWSQVQVVDAGSGGRAAVGQVLLGRRRVHVGPEGSTLLRSLTAGAR